MRLRRTCPEAARLITHRLDRELPLAERVVLRMHLLACDACPRFDKQMKLLQSAMQRWRKEANGGEQARR